jgi:hypothetical protein
VNARQSSRTALQKKTRRRSFIETIWDAVSGKTDRSRREKQRGMQFESLEDRKVLTTYFFENNSAISIPDSGIATPYPSTISVAGTSGNITGVTASINNFSHGFVDDVAILLQSPTTNTELLRNAGGTNSVTNVTYTFADGGSGHPRQLKCGHGNLCALPVQHCDLPGYRADSHRHDDGGAQWGQRQWKLEPVRI